MSLGFNSIYLKKENLTESKINIYMSQSCSHENKTQKSAKNTFHFRFLKLFFLFRQKTILSVARKPNSMNSNFYFQQ